MGGINHQPCNRAPGKYLYFSTLMSKSMSDARASLENANSCLEDILLAEMNGVSVSTTGILKHLTRSTNSLRDMQKTITDLRTNMRETNFNDLPTLHTINLDATGQNFTNAGIVDHASWTTIANHMRQSGFYAVLEMFNYEAVALIEMTDTLAICITNLDVVARRGGVTEIVEHNLEGNLKVPFARLYAKWTAFQALFLASSMLSTELWYTHNNEGSVLDFGMSRAAVA